MRRENLQHDLRQLVRALKLRSMAATGNDRQRRTRELRLQGLRIIERYKAVGCSPDQIDRQWKTCQLAIEQVIRHVFFAGSQQARNRTDIRDPDEVVEDKTRRAGRGWIEHGLECAFSLFPVLWHEADFCCALDGPAVDEKDS